jgi:hypothetical protein
MESIVWILLLEHRVLAEYFSPRGGDGKPYRHCIVNTAQLRTVCILHKVYCVLHTAQCAVHTIYCILYTAQCALYTVNYVYCT